MKPETRDAIIAGIVTTAAIVAQVILTDPAMQITVKAWWARLKAEWQGARDAYDGGEALVNLLAHEGVGAVVDEANRITREAVTDGR